MISLPATTLSADDEAQLAHQAKAGCRESRQRLIESQLPWAAKLAAKYKDRGVPYDDLKSTAWMAVCRAVDAFDPSRGRLTTFATVYVNRDCWRALKRERKTNATAGAMGDVLAHDTSELSTSERRRFLSAVRALPETQARAVYGILQGEDVATTAAEAGVSERRVYLSRLRARKALARMLG